MATEVSRDLHDGPTESELPFRCSQKGTRSARTSLGAVNQTNSWSTSNNPKHLVIRNWKPTLSVQQASRHLAGSWYVDKNCYTGSAAGPDVPLSYSLDHGDRYSW